VEGRQTNRSALGARIEVEVETPHGVKTHYAVVSTGGSFGGSPLTQHIGLGDAARVRRMAVTWPRSGKVQTVENPGLNQRVKVVER
ncbi:MAG: ASPIC/UnbV domain-containing protein, partial [Chthoniobacterales bacterium]